jgi:hypothetical protein
MEKSRFSFSMLTPRFVFAEPYLSGLINPRLQSAATNG